MRQQGQIKDWKDDKGFGFVVPITAGAEQAFVHANSFLNRQRRPVNGDLISYDAVQDFQKRWQAQAIRYVDELPKEASPSGSAPTSKPSKGGSSWSALPLLRVLLGLLILGILGLVGYQLSRPEARRSDRGAQSLIGSTAASQASGRVDPSPPAPTEPTEPQSSGDASAASPFSHAAPAALPFTGAEPMDAQAAPFAASDDSPYRCDGRTRCGQMHSCEEANWFVAHCPNTEMDGDGDGVACERQWCTGG